MPTYGSRWPTYAKQWDSMMIRPNRLNEFKTIAKRLFNAKERYVNVQNKTGVPWYMIAVIHEREASQNWKTQLAQGDPLSRKSTHDPKGMGPYSTWEEGALAALKHDGLINVKDWRLEKVLYHLEGFNGWGYFNHGVPSAYVWAGTNVYNRGKYVSDGVWSTSAVDTQPGAAALLKCLMDLDPTIKPLRETTEVATAATIGVGSVATIATATTLAAPPNYWLYGLLIGLGVALIAGLAYYLIKRKNKDVNVLEQVPSVGGQHPTGTEDKTT